jgi:ubiquinone biosynthesis protein UbiJ
MRLTPLEAVLNRNIAASSAARSLCKRLDAKVLALHVSGLPLSIYFESHGERMSLQTTHSGTPDATLSGTPLSFMRLAGSVPETALRAGAVQIEGDAEVAQTFSDLLRATRPDLEEELSRVIGDVAAHQVGNVARSALGLARRASDTLARNVAEYLQEEGRDVPSHTEAEEFFLGVDTLRDAVDRLEARINLLSQRRRGQQR